MIRQPSRSSCQPSRSSCQPSKRRPVPILDRLPAPVRDRFAALHEDVNRHECVYLPGRVRDPVTYRRVNCAPTGRGAVLLAHRISYAVYYGRDPAPESQLHHTCHNKSCVNPLHLEQVDPGEHNRLHLLAPGSRWLGYREECRHGHDLTDPSNVYRPPGYPERRMCRSCRQVSR